jgi:hypothetical protein
MTQYITAYHDKIELYKKLELTLQETLLLKSLEHFYENEEYFNLLNSIIDGSSLISRRTFEYFVTNYAMRHNIVFDMMDKGNKIHLIVHSSYKDQLKAHRKKYFDPFGRGDRIPFFSKNNSIITTIGQLNFYRWFFSKKIYDYCLLHYKEIQTELFSNKTISKKKIKLNKKIVTPIVKKQINYIKVEYNPSLTTDIIVTFDL